MVRIGDCTLYLGDCQQILPTLGRIDAVITDPPFGIGFKYASHDDTPDGYGEWLWTIISEAERLLFPGSPVFVFQAMLNAPHFHAWFPRNWRIYAAAKNFVQMRPTAMQYAWDPVVVWWTDGEAYKSDARDIVNRDFFVANTAGNVSNTKALEKGHPCPRPLDQMRVIVGQWARPGGEVLDMFMGAGTTGVACVEEGRKFIGIEKDPKYFDIACRRIDAAYKRPKLFESAPLEQGELISEGE